MLRRLLLGLLLAGAAHADPVAWRVSAETGDTWLLGSVHYLREADYPLPALVDALYERADRLVMELDLDDLDAARVRSALVSAAVLPEGRSLADTLDDDVYRLAEVRARDLGIDLEELAAFKPWLVALTFTDIGMGRQGYRADRGLEQYLLGRAARDGKPVVGLESLDAQVGVFESLSAEEQQALLEQTLAELEEADSTTSRLVDAWRDGRLEQLGDELLGEFEQYPRLYRMLVTERNRSWVAPLVEHIERPGDELVVVGALHLVGKDSVIEMLRQRGFTVERATP